MSTVVRDTGERAVLPPFTEEHEELRESVRRFVSKEIAPRHTGRLGYALRVSPNHYDDPLTRPCPDLLRWS